MRAAVLKSVRGPAWVLVGALAGVAAVGCAARGGDLAAVDGGDRYGAESAEVAIGRFLDAARLRDYPAMARLFGTAEGPAERRWGRVETERRMFVLASLLAPRAYGLRSNPVSEAGGASRWMVDLAGTRNGDVSLPFIVTSQGDRWFVERIVTEGLRAP
ncbi:hypothetical protein [Candidatus Palauibacter sp.]|uniref:hypothetical protein n=1 Tax=Candidatus Palauibacter sp. TaxID=3101350 RepID=UPI003B52756E